MNLGDLYDEIEQDVNEAGEITPLVQNAVRRAALGIERKLSFDYMKEVIYVRAREFTQPKAIKHTVEVVSGNTDLQASNPSGGGGSGAVDGKLRFASIFTPIYSEFEPGDWVQFDGNFGPHYATLDGTFGQIMEVNALTFGGHIIVAVPDDSPYSLDEFQPIGFKIHKLAGNPFAVSGTDPGLVSLGVGVKRIGTMDLCAASDHREVIQRGLRKLNPIETSGAEESWNHLDQGDRPRGYVQLGLARNLSPRIQGSAVFDPEEYMILLRPFPSELFYLRTEVYRYSVWEKGNRSFTHPLLDTMYDYLMALAIVELGAPLRDPKLMETYGALVQAKETQLIHADIEMQEGNDSASMEYDPDSASR